MKGAFKQMNKIKSQFYRLEPIHKLYNNFSTLLYENRLVGAKTLFSLRLNFHGLNSRNANKLRFSL